MCGFAGFWGARLDSEDVLCATAEKMAATLVHRGPDDRAAWADGSAGVALGFRRLAIIDLSPHGRQPMHSESGRYTIVYNGEVYNFRALGNELAQLGHRFHGHSDTEVILAAVEEWGLERAVRRFVGMFAFALWDRVDRRLSLVRDRLGIKPLYYARMGQTFLFGSELKALRAHPAMRPELDRGSLSLYLLGGYVPAPRTIYERTRKLPPGCILTLSCAQDEAEPAPYWSLKQIAEQGAVEPFTGTEEDAVLELERRLTESVGLRLIADVPLGALLSGGIDSSTIVALMQAQSSRPVKTFSIGFHESGYDEASHARSIAGHLGTDHTELYVTPEDAMNVIPLLPDMYDEPLADPAEIPTFLISKLARQQVTVGLTGDGGDELFAGYDHYARNQMTWRLFFTLPVGARQLGLKVAAGVPRPVWERITAPFRPTQHPAVRRLSSGDGLRWTFQSLGYEHWEDVYPRVASQWPSPADMVLGGYEADSRLGDRAWWASLPSAPERMMFHDQTSLLPDMFLVKVDRASMAVSLEARVPLLDHRVVEFAASVPLAMKMAGGERKIILRRLLDRYVPRALVDRPKQGFSVPIKSWLRGPLRDWAEDLLSQERLERDGIFDPGPIRRRWEEHLAGTEDWHVSLWQVLMFQLWADRWCSQGP